TKINYEQLTQTRLSIIDQLSKLFPQWKRSSVIKKVKESIEGKDIRFVATINGEIIAHVKYGKGKGIHKHIVDVTSLVVSKNHRRKGIANELMKYSIKKLPKEIKIITLAVDNKNKPAIKLYKKLKFKKYGLLKKASLIKGKYVDNYMMELHI
ncbi:MAG: GNAT family N-acetyltransferase, partial [Candidatus Diapherotrites archaeon]|nr:GNAT family N-acetyltransferase [Candidatus Diapherotrites archaeon]